MHNPILIIVHLIRSNLHISHYRYLRVLQYVTHFSNPFVVDQFCINGGIFNIQFIGKQLTNSLVIGQYGTFYPLPGPLY